MSQWQPGTFDDPDNPDRDECLAKQPQINPLKNVQHMAMTIQLEDSYYQGHPTSLSATAAIQATPGTWGAYTESYNAYIINLWVLIPDMFTACKNNRICSVISAALIPAKNYIEGNAYYRTLSNSYAIHASHNMPRIVFAYPTVAPIDTTFYNNLKKSYLYLQYITFDKPDIN